ncbi:NAD-dependent epimerase/dehydratase family protein [Sorangium sp. So ce131]|uniref:NAD-dependent epimerase/dehydratase family protein n=1 Tax=Sorangium sp. So ce131 TaxID=3133282 RepID=UPI003F5F8F63
MQRAFLTGAAGYIGGSVARRLRQEGFEVAGLVRSADGAARVEALGVAPVLGTLDDAALLEVQAAAADVVVNAASSDHRGAVEALLRGLQGTGKTLVHTSGSSIVADDAGGEPSDLVYDERTPFTPVPARAARVAIDRLVTGAAQEGVRSIVLCPTMIYGHGTGAKRDSIQVPTLVRAAEVRGAGVHVGRGLNVWSNVHIEDLVDLYLLAIERAEPGSFFFAENGEAALRDIAIAISKRLGFGGRTVAWPLDEAIRELGEGSARYSLGSNSRVRAAAARQLLGWTPRRTSLLEDVELGRG